MRDVVILFFAWCIGLGLGAFFFGGLWWTLRKSLPSTRPALWLLGSLLLRMSVTLAGFYYVVSNGWFSGWQLGEGHWLSLLLCLLGFIIARIAVTRFTRLAVTGKMELRHAP